MPPTDGVCRASCVGRLLESVLSGFPLGGKGIGGGGVPPLSRRELLGSFFKDNKVESLSPQIRYFPWM